MLGVIGDPISHSKSPLMMNRALHLLGLNYAYAAFHVTPDRLAAALAGVRALHFRGLNVTIPHKEAVIPLLDELDESARLIGAVNTIVNNDGVMRGYNTDGVGYVRSLEEETGIELAGKSVVVLGAGGAARAVIYALGKRGVGTIRLANRTIARAEQVAQDFAGLVDVRPMTLSELPLKMDVDLLINTTSVGMAPAVDDCPLPDLTWIGAGMTVSDLIYNPRETKLLRLATAAGARTHGGLGMLVGQGAIAFEYWTGQAAPVAEMRAALTGGFS